ncbi:MAG: flagellar hook protein FlgE [Janthinobacterium lividum]
MFFSTPLSGLDASSAALKTVSNNLANMNTDGYKSQSATFSDLFYQNYGASGSGDPIQSGLGVRVSGNTQDFSNGVVSSNGVASNMALNGSGFFVVQNPDGGQSFTRNGDFTTNKAGQLITQAGEQVMGYPASGGVVSTNAKLVPLAVGSGTTAPATPTSSFTLNTNLDSATANGSSFQSPISVYDSLGASHVLTVTYTKNSANNWSYNVTIPSSDVQGGTGATTSVATGTMTFDSTGALTSPTGSIPINVGPMANGAANMTQTWDLADTNGGSLLTQTASSSSNNSTNQDGFAAGVLNSYVVEKDGTVNGTFSNGQTRTIGQVAVASFANPQGLTLNGNNDFTSTTASGSAVIGVAGTGGRGSIASASVEQSNVDVAQQFAQLIVFQRAYEANAKAITAFDQLEQDTIAMKS